MKNYIRLIKLGIGLCLSIILGFEINLMVGFIMSGWFLADGMYDVVGENKN